MLDNGETVMGLLLFVAPPGELGATEESQGAGRCLGVGRHVSDH